MIQRELNFSGPSPLLYLVATPIGNLGEISNRALEVIKASDYIAAEDTRHSGEMLTRLGIKKPMLSCHEHNEEEMGEKIVALLKEGKKVAYMSDAGYPCISDPGERLAKKCIANGIKVSTVSGSSAFLSALCASGIESNHFYFYGFLSSKDSEKKKELEELKPRKETIIFYEAPHRIKKTLALMLTVLGDRFVCLARELTKTHEEFIRANLSELNQLEEDSLKGEMVLVVTGNKENDEVVSQESIVSALKQSLDLGLKSKQAIQLVSKQLNVPKNEVYDLYLASFKKD